LTEYKWKKPQKRTLIQIRKDEPKQWLQDFSILAFYDPDYSPSEIDQIKKMGTSVQTLWKDLPIEGSKISFAFKTSHDFKINKNRSAYNIFVNENLHDPKFQEKYVVFVNGQLEDVADNEVELVKQVHEKYGNIDMYVGKVSLEKTKGMIESPER